MVENPVHGESDQNDGVLGVSNAPGKAGVAGVNESVSGGNGIYGRGSVNGVYGQSTTSAGSGIVGVSDYNDAVLGVSKASGKAGVAGVNESGGNGIYGRGSVNGVVGVSDFNDAVLGVSKAKGHAGVAGVNSCVGSGAGSGVYGHSDDGVGVWGSSNTYEGVHAETKSKSTAAMAAYQMEPTSDTAAFYAKHAGNRLAGFFEGNAVVTGTFSAHGVPYDTLVQRITQLENQNTNVGQRVAALENQLNAAVSNLTARVTQTEISISTINSEIQQIIARLT